MAPQQMNKLYAPSGLDKLRMGALQFAVSIVRSASHSGAKRATKADVQTAAALSHARQSGGYTVLSMKYFKPEQEGGGEGAVSMPTAYFGREPVRCGVFTPQCGGGRIVSAEDLRNALDSENIPYTRFAFDEALQQADKMVANVVEPKLKAAFPRTSVWTGKHVARVI